MDAQTRTITKFPALHYLLNVETQPGKSVQFLLVVDVVIHRQLLHLKNTSFLTRKLQQLCLSSGTSGLAHRCMTRCFDVQRTDVTDPAAFCLTLMKMCSAAVVEPEPSPESRQYGGALRSCRVFDIRI